MKIRLKLYLVDEAGGVGGGGRARADEGLHPAQQPRPGWLGRARPVWLALDPALGPAPARPLLLGRGRGRGQDAQAGVPPDLVIPRTWYCNVAKLDIILSAMSHLYGLRWWEAGLGSCSGGTQPTTARSFSSSVGVTGSSLALDPNCRDLFAKSIVDNLEKYLL